jgi:stage II sporulation protein D
MMNEKQIVFLFIIHHSAFIIFSEAIQDVRARMAGGIRQTRQAAAQRGAATARQRRLGFAARHGLTHLCLCVALFCAWSTPTDVVKPKPARAPFVALDDAALDAILQSAATDALGAREGAIIVLDPQTGRVRAIVNPRLAGEQAFPPGSAIKPFTLLTALRSGALDKDTRLLCRKHYARQDAHFTCSHPASLPPFSPAQALAYSCNYFFARVGERLKPDDFNATLAAYGFGARTGLADEFEQPGKLPRARWHLSEALGEGDDLLVTPVQLLTAYAALLNGGHLYTPQTAAPENFSAHERATVEIANAERALLLEGMRGAVAYGTAERAHLSSLPVNIYGKTGTATEVGGIHTHGWFVGFATENKQTPTTTQARMNDLEQTSAGTSAHAQSPAPEQFKLAVLVFLKRATGVQSATVAQPIFAAYARATTEANAEVKTDRAAATMRAAERSYDLSAETAQDSSTPDNSTHEPTVRVHLVREETTRTLSLEDYIYGVLAAEASTEDEYEAIKALAVVSRTFALKNLHRHARDGYDFCNLTHCQRYLAVKPDDDTRPEFHALLRRAVNETAGEVLHDGRGQLINAYFSASCGGMTANVETLWGATAHERYERGVRDDFCVGASNSSWTDVLPAAQLARALHEDERSDVGARLDDIRVIKRDASGRAEIVAVRGERQRVLRGWDFKTIVGRTLGWNVLKSSRFTVERAGANFIFRGSGFGHGLGLCQTGAHVQAERGTDYRQILAYYFPGTKLTQLSDASAQWHDDVLWRGRDNSINRTRAASAASASTRLTLSSEHFRVSYTAQAEQRDVEAVLRTLEAARADMQQRLAAASLDLPALPVLEIVAHETTGDFVGATGQPAWAAAATRGRHIELQPLATLRKRGVLTTTLRHEYAHAVIDALSRGRAPHWLAEGLAAYAAGEGALLAHVAAPSKRLTTDELEQQLAQPASATEMRTLYAAAYREVRALIGKEGEASVWRRVAHS